MEVELRATVTDDDADNTLTYEWTATNPVGTDTGTFSPTDAATTTWTAPAKTNTEQAIVLTLTVTESGRVERQEDGHDPGFAQPETADYRHHD